ncbi:MAG: GNAT family N-acetyltransferase [Oscillospiraceae bacterium]|nr:GNAT family N-acetyltransferase [Oscillospiraceae bacterium]
MTITITRATRNDLPGILALQKLAYQSEAALRNDYTLPPLHQTLAEIQAEFELAIFLKATNECNRLIGSVRARVESGTAYIGKLVVQPEHQGQGVGTKLLAAVEHESQAARFELFTGDKSLRNLALYTKLGYTETHRQATPNGWSMVFMEKLSH